VDLYSPASTGQNFPDYWQHDADGWHLMNNAPQMDFAALLEASTVPEPSVLALAGLGALALAVARWRRG
jgi:hypothetical protein